MIKELNGIWWLPSEEDRKHHGTIKISLKGKVKLHIFGKLEDESFNNYSMIIGGELFSYPIINGTTIDGKKFTLVNSELSGEYINVNGIVNQTYSPSFTYVGKHINNIDDIKFNSFSIGLSYLSSWFKDTGFIQKTNFDKENFSEYKLTYSSPKKIDITDKDYILSIFRTFKTNGSFKTGIELKEDIHFAVKLNNYYDIIHLFESYIRPLQNLITLSTNRPSSINELHVYLKENNDDRTNTLDVYYEKNFWDEQNTKDLVRSRMLLKAEDIEQGYDMFFKRWFRLSSELKDVFSFLFAPIYNNNMYLQNEYFSIIQAVEGFHRSLFNEEGENIFNQLSLSKNDFNEKRNLIKSKIPKEHQEWFYSKTQYNEPSLKNRITDLIEYIQAKTDTKLFNSKLIAKKAADFRNTLAHPETGRSIVEDDFESIVYIQEILTYFLYLIIFIELGFSKKYLKKIIDDKVLFYINRIK